MTRRSAPGSAPRGTARSSPKSAEQVWQRSQGAGRRWALGGALLGLLGGLVLFAPASWLANGLFSASGEHFLLADAQGSIWTGSAVAVLQGGPGSRDAAALPGRLHWRLRPSWTGLNLRLRHACCLRGDVEVQVQPNWQGATVVLPARPDGLGQWPTQWLMGLGTPWNTLQLGGVMALRSTGFSVQSVAGRVRLSGALDLDLLGVRSRLSPIDPLGTYHLNLRADASTGETAALVLDTRDGALRMNGTGQWAGTRLRFRGEAQAAPGQEPGLNNLLNIIGRRQGALSVISIG